MRRIVQDSSRREEILTGGSGFGERPGIGEILYSLNAVEQILQGSTAKMESSTSGVKHYLITDEHVSPEDSSGIKDYLITDEPVSPEDGRSSEQWHSWLGNFEGMSEYMKNWVEDTSFKGGIPDDLPDIEGHKAPTSGRSKSLSDLNPRRGSNPFRVSHLVIEEYTWERVMAMITGEEITLGHGSFGTVYKGTLDNNMHVAVKILAATSKQGDQEFYNEVELLSRLNHINLVKLLGCCQENRKRILVYEYAEEGCVYEHLHGKRPSLDWKTRLSIALDSARGIEYLHFGCTPRIIHRDIKSRNILLAKNLVAKVADFGLSKLRAEGENSDQSDFITAVKGTTGYLDPEYCRTNTLNPNSDIYSFGVVLLEIVTGRKPIVAETHISDWVKAQMKTVGLKGVIDPKLGDAYNIKSARMVVNLALSCLHQSSKTRPDIREVVKRLGAAGDEASNIPKKNSWFKLV